jgi:hypothetical protein
VTSELVNMRCMAGTNIMLLVVLSCMTFTQPVQDTRAGWRNRVTPGESTPPNLVNSNARRARGKKKQSTLTLAMGLRPRTRIAKVFALGLVAMRVLLGGVGRQQAIGEARDRGQALLM